ncbi:MAG: hypothetical protein IT563_24795 [Alphaproteobacteria bacterium]|nr:hypothetical protein [Alphaproteobacteria bacterium]
MEQHERALMEADANVTADHLIAATANWARERGQAAIALEAFGVAETAVHDGIARSAPRAMANSPRRPCG